MKIINVSSLTCPYANMQLLYPSIQFSTIGNPATLNTLSCFEWNVKRRCNKKNWGGQMSQWRRKIITCVTCSSATKSNVKRDSGCPVQVIDWSLSLLTHFVGPCTDISELLRGRIRITTYNQITPHFLNQVTIKNHNTLDDTKDAT